MIIREANINDWKELLIFFNKIYRKEHPLQNREFWEWQFGNPKYGRSFVCFNENGKVVGHVGANFVSEIAWMINAFLNKEYRGMGILGKLYGLARNFYPLAATAANESGLGMYRNMRWIRYYDLVRYVKLNPYLNNTSFENVCQSIIVEVDALINKECHFFQQPNLKGIILGNNNQAVSQEKVGGLRIVSFENIKEIEDQAWQIGYNWVDYVTSWNDLKIKDLEKNSWILDYKSVVPWRLNPIIKNYFCDVTFLSEKPLSNELVVHRSFSDHGRIGSI